MPEIKRIDLRRSIFEDNNADADKLRRELKSQKTCLLNFMSSPGAGKTSLLTALATYLNGRIKWGVMEADIDSSVDAKIIAAAGVPAIQLHTGGMCHLDADMTRQGLREFARPDLDLVILENVGNLVCPAEFDTGAAKNVTLLSVPEGHDKPLKYPLMYQTCGLLVVAKTDVLPYFDFDQGKIVEYARMRNPKIEILFVSAKTGDGVSLLADWIIRQVREWQDEQREGRAPGGNFTARSYMHDIGGGPSW